MAAKEISVDAVAAALSSKVDAILYFFFCLLKEPFFHQTHFSLVCVLILQAAPPAATAGQSGSYEI